MTQFGDVPADAIERPGAYAVVVRSDGYVALAATPIGHILPGGGQDPEEPIEDTLHRELAEETGLLVRIERSLGFARQVVPRRGRPAWNKVCHYFLCTPRGLTAKVEDDHELVWVPQDRTLDMVQLPVDRWALRRALS